MENVYLGCLIGGIIFAVITILFGDIIDSTFDGFFEAISLDGFDFIDTTVIVAGITIFGGTGILLNTYSPWKTISVLLTTVVITLILTMFFFFLYIKPMKNCENSIGFSVKDFIGKTGEVTVPIGPKGFGEILLKIGVGHTNQIAASFDGKEYSTGLMIVVTDVKDGTVYVSNSEDKK
ncbi:MAG: protease [Clostridia bacterium]|nr:protease [Clostridia bacterium]MDD4049061.1 protease [Clostridia bacterium]